MVEFDKRKMALAAAASLAFLALVIFGYVPIAWQKYVLHQSLRRQSLSIDQVRECSARLPEIERQVAELRPVAEKVQHRIPENRHFASFWQEITDLMSRHNLQNQQVKPGEETQDGEVHSVALEIQCAGKLSDVFAFIGSLEQMERLVRIEQMDLSNDKDYTGMLTLSAKASVFYRTQKSKKPS